MSKVFNFKIGDLVTSNTGSKKTGVILRRICLRHHPGYLVRVSGSKRIVACLNKSLKLASSLNEK